MGSAGVQGEDPKREVGGEVLVERCRGGNGQGAGGLSAAKVFGRCWGVGACGGKGGIHVWRVSYAGDGGEGIGDWGGVVVGSTGLGRGDWIEGINPELLAWLKVCSRLHVIVALELLGLGHGQADSRYLHRLF